MTERDMDAASRQFLQSFRGDTEDYQPDLEVDGLSEGFFSRLLGLLGDGRS